MWLILSLDIHDFMRFEIVDDDEYIHIFAPWSPCICSPVAP